MNEIEFEKLQLAYAELDANYKRLMDRHDAVMDILAQIAREDRSTGNLMLAQIAYKQVCELARAALTLEGRR